MTSATTQAGTLQLVAKATGSYSHTINGYQGDDAARGNCAWGLRRLPHGHVGHVGVRVDLKDRAPASSISVSACRRNFPDNWRGARLASFSRIPHWLPSPPLATDRRVAKTSLQVARLNLRERAVTGCASPFHSVRVLGCNPSALNTCLHQRLVNHSADRLHLSNALSSSLVSVGIDPNENGLTRGKQEIAFGANSSD